MNIYELVAAFGAGVFGALIGGVPAFILTGLVAVVAGILSMAGLMPAEVTDYIAFGSYLGPHITFAGAVAAAAYAARKGVAPSGTDIVTPLNTYGDPTVFMMGGLFGMLGYVIEFFYQDICHFGGDLTSKLATDLPGITVVTSAVIARLLFGKTGLIGKYKEKELWKWLTNIREIIYHGIIGLSIGIMVSAIGIALLKAGVDTSLYPVTCFGLAAFGLIFSVRGSRYYVHHHIVLPAATAAVLSGNIIVGAIVGMICAILTDSFAKIFNSHVETHIDPPAITIFISVFIINAVWG